MSSKQYTGIAPLTMARTAAGGYINILKGDPVPDSIDVEDRKRLVREGFLDEVKATEPTDGDDSIGKSDKVADILAEVGDDKDKAKAALETEQAKGDAARPTLVEKLQAILAA